MELPLFRYLPDSVETGMPVRSNVACGACGKSRGYFYSGVPYYVAAVEAESICPWCIADGSTHEKLGTEFTDLAFIGRGLVGSSSVPLEIEEEVTYRKPGFISWRGDYWFAHCGDGAAFLGSAGIKELNAAGPEAVEAIRTSIGAVSHADELFAGLERNGPPSAYLFRCLHCGQFGDYTDQD